VVDIGSLSVDMCFVDRIERRVVGRRGRTVAVAA